MPKMIKLTYTRPSTDVEWPRPLSSYSGYDGLSNDIKTSWTNYNAGINYAVAPADSAQKAQTIVNSPNELSMEQYFWFSDYPETTPANLKNYFYTKIRAYESTVADENVTGTNPITNEAMTVSFNKFNRWIRAYQNDNGIVVASVEEVDYDFPA